MVVSLGRVGGSGCLPDSPGPKLCTKAGPTSKFNGMNEIAAGSFGLVVFEVLVSGCWRLKVGISCTGSKSAVFRVNGIPSFWLRIFSNQCPGELQLKKSPFFVSVHGLRQTFPHSKTPVYSTWPSLVMIVQCTPQRVCH